MDNKMNEIVRLGIIGCGSIANQKHMPALQKIKNARMVAFCDVIRERAEKAAKEFGDQGVKVYTDYRELLEDKTIDAVHVCTPNKAHSFISIAAMEAGKHVLCEKPIARNVEEAKAMIEAAQRTGKILTIGYQNRFRPDIQYLHEICRKGDLGDIYLAKAQATRRRGIPSWGVFLDKEQQGGGALIDIGSHALDLTLWLMDNYQPKMVVGNTYSQFIDSKIDIEDYGIGYITMKNGATIVLEASWAMNTLEPTVKPKTKLFGTRGGADLTNGLRINGETPSGRLYTTIYEIGSTEITNMIDHAFKEASQWIDSIIYGTEPLVKPEQALVVSEIVEAIYTSAKTGKPVFFD